MVGKFTLEWSCTSKSNENNLTNGIFVHYHITVPFFELNRIVVDLFIRFINSFQYSIWRRLIHINIITSFAGGNKWTIDANNV